jgi:chromosome segregation ATPase
MHTRQDPMALASTRVTFTHASEQNIRNMTEEIEEYKARIRDLEVESRHYKVDWKSILKFRAYANEVREELGTTLRQLYTSLKEFQDLSTQLLTFSDIVKTKNVELQRIRLSMDELKRW